MSTLHVDVDHCYFMHEIGFWKSRLWNKEPILDVDDWKELLNIEFGVLSRHAA